MSNLLILGAGRSGKDTAGAFLHGDRMRYCGSTSLALLEHVTRKWIKQHGLLVVEYDNLSALLYETRHDNREFWYETGNEIRDLYGPTTLIRDMLPKYEYTDGYIVAGLRDQCEVDAACQQGLFSHVLWIQGQTEDPTFKITLDATVRAIVCSPRAMRLDVIINTGTLNEYYPKLTALKERYGW